MGYLKDTKCYLSHPIQFQNMGDPNWKPEVIKDLTTLFGINVFDPQADEKQKRAALLKSSMEKGDFDIVEEVATAFSKKDLAEIDRTDFLVAYNPYKVCTIGVPCEVHHAIQLKKPVLIVCPQGKQFAGIWYFGNIRHRYIYGSWQDLYAYLREVDEGKQKDNHRWWYVYKMV